MKLQGMIKSIKAAVTVGGPDVNQAVVFEVHGPWADLRDLMQKPLNIEIEAQQLEIGDIKPPQKGRRGRLKEPALHG